jgi:glycosyltransferase involved in cell wall biosynthesis
MRRLKVLFITHWYPVPEQPVKGIFIREHARAVAERHDVVVLHCAGKEPLLDAMWRMEEETAPEMTAGIPTYRVWRRSGPVPGVSSAAYLQGVIGAYRRLAEAGFRPDILHANVYEAGVPAVLIGRQTGAPVVISEHASDFVRRRLPPWQVQKARFAFSRAARVLPVSRTLQSAIERYGIRARFSVVPNVVDTDLFKPATEPQRRDGARRLATVGSLVPIKGFDHLLRAMALLRSERDDWRLFIVGEGPERQALTGLAETLGLSDRVTFLGQVPKPELAELLRSVDLFVVSSLVETFSAAAAEALASGVPVLATRCGGPEEYLTPDLGHLVAPGDPEALRDGLADMLNRPDTFSRSALAAFARRRFSLDEVGRQLDAVYEECLPGGRGPGD